MSRVNRPAMGIARVARYMKGQEDKFSVIVGTVTDDIRLTGCKLPALKIVALRVTEGARARIVQAGGEIFTFDQLAMMAPKGKNTVILRGRKSARVSAKYFGTPGVPNSTARCVFCQVDLWKRGRSLGSLHALPCWLPPFSSCLTPSFILPFLRLSPRVRSKGRKFEKARGRRASRGYKV
jgi:large subunit ribosomal protein L18e